MLRPSITLLISTVVLASACPDVSAFQRPPTGSRCDWEAGPHRPLEPANRREDGSVLFTLCDHERIFNGIVYPETVEEANPCGEGNLLGEGECITYCVPDADVPDRFYSARVCVVDPVPPRRDGNAPWDVSVEGCDGILGSALDYDLPEDGDACAGDGWGCAGLVGYQPGVLWCAHGTLRVVFVENYGMIPHINDVLSSPPR